MSEAPRYRERPEVDRDVYKNLEVDYQEASGVFSEKADSIFSLPGREWNQY
jgi:hypothetical protein